MKIEDLGLIAGGVLVAIIVLALGGNIMGSLAEDTDYVVGSTVAVAETAFSFNGSIAIQLANTNITYDTVIVTNVTGSVVVNSANYSIDYVLGTVTPVTANSYNESQVNITYEYDVFFKDAKDAMLNGSKSLSTFAKWTPTIALVAIAAIILGLVFTGLFFWFKD